MIYSTDFKLGERFWSFAGGHGLGVKYGGGKGEECFDRSESGLDTVAMQAPSLALPLAIVHDRRRKAALRFRTYD